MTRAFAATGAILLAALTLSACATARAPGPLPSPYATAPSAIGIYKIGNPYQVAGVWYYPKEQPGYDETGIASWYGAEFHGRLTANGEVFDRNSMTAAHTTLPMPVNVRVTNLENGRSLVVRVNDRGPYVNGRVIDLSERAADLLGFRTKGTAKVRVTYLGRADLNGNGYASPSELTPPEIATAVKAAPTETINTAPLAPVPGAAVAPERPVRRAPMPTQVEVASLPPPAANGEVIVVPVPVTTAIYVQAGAYVSRDNAGRVATRLKALGAKVTPSMKDGRTVYRVRIGPLPDVDRADAALLEVHTLGQNDASIVVE